MKSRALRKPLIVCCYQLLVEKISVAWLKRGYKLDATLISKFLPIE